jgi:hypothetical protein
VPALEASALAEAMIRLWRDEAERARFAEAGLARSADFAFDRWVGSMFAVYRDELAAASGKAGSPAR